MLQELWQWLKQCFRRLLGKKPTPPLREQRQVEPPQQLSDTEYESLFLRLLTGVNDQGWSRDKVKGFLDINSVHQGSLVEWLHGFGARLLASPVANDQLAIRMIRLGELSIGEVGDVAHEIGWRLQEIKEKNRKITEDAAKKNQAEAEVWFNQGCEQLIAEDLQGAIASFDKALELQLDHQEAWYKRGVILGNLGRYEQALASFDKALQLRPDCQLAWYNRGVALESLGRCEQAIASFDKALEFKPDCYVSWYNRGVSLSNLGRCEQALVSFDKALEFKPDFHAAWYNRGVTLGNLEQYEQALASFDKALEFKPDFHKAGYN